MKSIYYVVALFIGAILFASCERMKPEIVESDYSYTPTDPTGEDRDKIGVPPADMLTQYVFFKDNDQKRQLRVFKDEKTLDIKALEDVKVTVSTAIPVKEDFTAEILLMNETNHPKTYTQVVMEGAQILPQEMYQMEMTSLDFKVGEREKVFNIKFDSEKMVSLSDEITYVLPLVIKVPEGKGLNLHNFFLVTIDKQEFQLVAEGENVELLSSTPSGASFLPSSSLNFDSNVLQSRLGGLKDGNTRSSSWWTKVQSEYLAVMFDNTPVGGLYIHGVSGSLINTLQVFVTVDGSTWVRQGEITNTERLLNLPIKFKKPISIQGIKIANMTPFQDLGVWIDIAELSVWEAQK